MTTIANGPVLPWLEPGAEPSDDDWAHSDGNLDHAIINANLQW